MSVRERVSDKHFEEGLGRGLSESVFDGKPTVCGSRLVAVCSDTLRPWLRDDRDQVLQSCYGISCASAVHSTVDVCAYTARTWMCGKIAYGG